MAIGKQGAYATVEGGVVDFGKITTEAIDKYQTQQALQQKLKQEKEAEAAKLKVEREKVPVKLDKFEPITGQGGISRLISEDLNEMANDIYNAKEAYSSGEIPLSKVTALEQAYNQRIFEYKSASDLAKTKMEDLSKNATKYDSDSVEESSDQFKALLRGDYQINKDAQGRRVYQKVEKDANGKVVKVLDEQYTPMDIVTKYNPIPKFDQAKDINDFTTKIAPLSKYTDFSGLTKITSETIAGNPKVKENIKAYVGALLSDPNKLAVLNKERTGVYQRTVTDPEEIKATAEWYGKRIEDGYKESVEKDRHYISPTSGGTDKDKDIRTVTTFKVPSGGVGKGYGISLNKKGEAVVYPSINIGGKKITNYNVDQFYWNKKGDLVISGTYESVRTSKMSPKDKKYYDYILNALLSDTATPEQQEKYDELVETYGSERIKQAATINKNREDLIFPIAAKLGYESVDEFNSAYRPNISQQRQTTTPGGASRFNKK